MDILCNDDGYWRHSEYTIQRYVHICESIGPADVLTAFTNLVPFRFPGLEAIGVIFMLLNIGLFLINVLMISLRFYCHPETFKASILHPTERLFIPAAAVSFGTVLLNIAQYGPSHAGYWLNEASIICFWINVALALLSSLGIYLVM